MARSKQEDTEARHRATVAEVDARSKKAVDAAEELVEGLQRRLEEIEKQAAHEAGLANAALEVAP